MSLRRGVRLVAGMYIVRAVRQCWAQADTVVVLAGRRRNVTSWLPAAAAALTLAGVLPSAARAAALIIEAPASCVDPSALADEVAELVGQPIEAVPHFDFRIQIAGTAHQRWRLRLETLDRSVPGSQAVIRGTRELEAATCAELAEAAALAIAVSLGTARAEPSPPAPPPVAAPAVPPLVVRSTSPPRPKTPWRAGAGLGVVVESGVLPNVAPGVELEARVDRGALGLALRGTWFGSQDTLGTAASGGSFQLASGTALACLGVPRGRWVPLVCAGFTLGRLAGRGLNVARPHTGAALWSAGRAELGVARRMGGDAAVFLRAGVAVPLARPTFVLDENQPVYRPGRIAGSVAAGIALEF